VSQATSDTALNTDSVPVPQKIDSGSSYFPVTVNCRLYTDRGQLKCDGTRAETRFRLSTKRTSPFKSGGGGGQSSRLLAAEVCASAVVMLETPCSEVVWRAPATHSIRQFPLHFPSRASPCAITFHLDCTTTRIKLWTEPSGLISARRQCRLCCNYFYLQEMRRGLLITINFISAVARLIPYLHEDDYCIFLHLINL